MYSVLILVFLVHVHIHVHYISHFIFSTENSSLFAEDSLMDGCVLTTPLSPSVLCTLSSCFDRLSRTHPLIVSHTLLSMVKKVLDEGGVIKDEVANTARPVGVVRGGASSVYLQLVLEMMLHSHSVLDLVITDVIKLSKSYRYGNVRNYPSYWTIILKFFFLSFPIHNFTLLFSLCL